VNEIARFLGIMGRGLDGLLQIGADPFCFAFLLFVVRVYETEPDAFESPTEKKKCEVEVFETFQKRVFFRPTPQVKCNDASKFLCYCSIIRNPCWNDHPKAFRSRGSGLQSERIEP